MAGTEAEIIEIIAKQMSLENDKVTPESTMEDLAIESLDLVEIIQNPTRSFVKCPPGAGRRHRPGGAVQQLHTKPGL